MPDYPISNFHFPIFTVSLSCVDLEDCTYQITTETSVDDLSCSIESVGLMCPPLLINQRPETGNSNVGRADFEHCPQPGGFTIVSGFRRIAACHCLGWSDIEARILNADTQKLDCVKFAITENAFQRPLNLIEMSRAVYMLSVFFKEDKKLAEAASAIGVLANPSLVKKLKAVCLLPGAIQDNVLSDTISLSMALELGRLEADAGVAFAGLFETLKLSLNKQREIITRVREIALREDISILDVIMGDDFQEILNNEDLDRNQKARDIRFYLKQRRFPAITRTETAFEALVKELNLGKNVSLRPPRDFEGTVYNLNLSFKDLTELKACGVSVEKIIQNPAFDRWLKGTDNDSCVKI
ncbi:ParB/RepB/Spo0J family partition protein [Desulfonema magnum]|uniref:ParB-like nuclease domain-containing protein n=1 Tax=Desulfonema magnum TaxID=45655 RepID=A0A975BRG9_9BACT|nr:ParB/RepB/Spo0J family partition protein [Desulfonema magnum]QTA89874.1 ParB-like nuclease domain-containing protein [Desulfonema magnum]